MAKVRNLTEKALEVPAAGWALVEPGGVLECDADLAKSLCEQESKWAPVKASKSSKKES